MCPGEKIGQLDLWAWGGGYLRLGGGEAQKQSWQESLSFSLAGATVTSPPAKMSRAQSKFW